MYISLSKFNRDVARSLMKVYNMPCRYTDYLYVYIILKNEKKDYILILYTRIIVIIFIISSVWREKLFV